MPLVSDLVEAGHEVHVISVDLGEQGEGTTALSDLPAGTNPPSAVHALPFLDVLQRKDIPAIAAVRRKVRDIEEALRPDLVHIFQFHAGLVFHLQQRRLKPIPTVLTIQGTSMLTETGPGANSLARRVVRESDWVVGCRPSLLDDLHSVVPEMVGRSSCIPNAAVDDGAMSSSMSLPEQTIVACGRFVEQKGFDVAIRAFAQLAEHRPALRLLIVGDGLDQRELQDLAQGSSAAGRIDFTGRVEPAVARQYLASASVVVMPSREAEGIPIVGLEAALAERPIVGSHIPGITEIIEHEQTGLLVEEDDTDGFAAALARCLDDSELAGRLGANARAHVVREFGWSGYVQSHEALYRRLTESRSAGTNTE